MVIDIKVLDSQTIDFVKLCQQHNIYVSFRTCYSETNFYVLIGSMRDLLLLFF